MDNNPWHDLGKQIGDTVRSAINEVGTSIKTATQYQGQQQPPNNQPNRQGYPQQQPPVNNPAQNGPNGPVYNAEPIYPHYNNPNGPLVRPNGPVWQGSLPKVKRDTNRFAGIAQMTLGILGIVLSAVGMLAVGVVGAVGLLSGGIAAPMLILAGTTAASAGVMAAGIGKRSLASKAYRMRLLLEEKKVCTIDQLAAVNARTPAQTRQDVKKALKMGYLPEVRMDAEETCAMLGADAFQLYLDSEKARKQKEMEEKERERRLGQAGSAEIERFSIEGEKSLSALREVRVHVQNEQIALKIKKLESTVEKIFTYVRQHPQKLPATRKFTSYYLPTTLKVLDKYRQYDSMDVQLASVQSAMREIEETLGTLDSAYTNLLENLYHEDTLDVTTDVEVLQSMLQQEGLAKDALQQELTADTQP